MRTRLNLGGGRVRLKDAGEGLAMRAEQGKKEVRDGRCDDAAGELEVGGGVKVRGVGGGGGVKVREVRGKGWSQGEGSWR